MKRKTKKKTIRCPYCGSEAVLRDSSFVYGNDNFGGHLYVCARYPMCNAYVGVHKHTLEPLGTLADGDLRHRRIEAHRVFDQLWRTGIMTRDGAYRWMQARFGLASKQAHISHFSEYMCGVLISEASKVLQANNRLAS